MICKNCGTENREERLFCKQCGSPLGWKCGCGFVNEEDALFCGACDSPKPNENIKSNYKQFTIMEIDTLLKEKIFVNIGDEEVINQNDIDKIF